MHVENPGRWGWVGLGWWQGNRKVADVKLEGKLMNSVTLKVGVRKGRTPGRLLLPTKIVRKRICEWRLWELPWVCWVQLILRHPCEDAGRPCECRPSMLRLQLVMSLIPDALWSSMGWWTDLHRGPSNASWPPFLLNMPPGRYSCWSQADPASLTNKKPYEACGRKRFPRAFWGAWKCPQAFTKVSGYWDPSPSTLAEACVFY